MNKRIVIIGNGISGITAARHIRKLSDHSITVISSETRHFFSRTALMYIYMGHMKFEHTKPYEDWFWKKNKIDLVFDHVEKVDSKQKTVKLKSGELVAYDDLVIATGSKSNIHDWPGKNLTGVQGLYHYPDLQRMEENTRNILHAVVVGGGLIGIEVAEMLRSRDIGVTMLVREKEFWSNVLPEEEARMIGRHVRTHHVDLRVSTELKEIISDTEGNVKRVQTTSGENIDCQFVALCVGVSPNIDWLIGSGIETNRGILVDKFLKTNIDNVFAIGDCVERNYELVGRKNIEQVWYTGRIMGETVAQTICGSPAVYEPGPWFNSAKFFDIEYQTYGNVPNQLADDQDGFYWEHEEGNKSVHVVWEKSSKRFVGINTFGIRMRHEHFDAWLRANKTIHFVMDHLAEANFDPEFFDRYEAQIVELFYRANSELVINENGGVG